MAIRDEKMSNFSPQSTSTPEEQRSKIQSEVENFETRNSKGGREKS